MEKRHKPANQIYHSKNILGMLYDQVQLVDFKPVWASSFDQRVLDAFEPEESSLERAAQIKAEYDEDLRRLMAKHGIETEFEAFTTFVLSHNQDTRDYKFAEEFGRTVGVLKAQYREVCMKASGATSIVDRDRLEPFVAAMYSVTAEEMKNALNECDETKIAGDHPQPLRKMEAKEMPLMSFPWLFHTQIGKLANRGAKPKLQPLQGKHRPEHNGMLIRTAEGPDPVEVDGDMTRFGEMLKLEFEEARTIEQQQGGDTDEHKEKEGLRIGSPPAVPSPASRP